MPLKVARNILDFALNNSVKALVDLLLKKFRIDKKPLTLPEKKT
jgi:hypothetical protein